VAAEEFSALLQQQMSRNLIEFKLRVASG
jgi:hypothetical protein